MQGNHDSLSEIGRIGMSEFQIIIEEAKDGVLRVLVENIDVELPTTLE